MSSEFGKYLQVTIFGQSHGKAVGVVLDGLPAGEPIDLAELRRFMQRRRPGGALSTPRREEDEPVFLSGLLGDQTCGSPLCAVIENQDARSEDYAELAALPRPSHADYAAYCKWGGKADLRGGGHFSGRLTAPICLAGGIAKQLLARRGVFVGAHLAEAGGEPDRSLPLFPTRGLLEEIADKPFPALDDRCGERMQAVIAAAAAEGDSVGGIVACAAIGLPAGLGSPMFGGLENRLAAALFGIPAVKGVEFGAGFASARQRGSDNNDPFLVDDRGEIVAAKNDSGGILGGISIGMPLVLRAAFKPTPSIGKPQQTVNLFTKKATEITIRGRHDPCVALRAVPAVEAVTALVLLDMILEEKYDGNIGNQE